MTQDKTYLVPLTGEQITTLELVLKDQNDVLRSQNSTCYDTPGSEERVEAYKDCIRTNEELIVHLLDQFKEDPIVPKRTDMDPRANVDLFCEQLPDKTWKFSVSISFLPLVLDDYSTPEEVQVVQWVFKDQPTFETDSIKYMC